MRENHQEFEKLRRELRITRIFSGVTSILLIGMLIGGFIVFSKVQEYAQTVVPLAEKVSEADFEVLNESMERLNETLNAFDWEKLSLQLKELDMDALNEAIAGLNTEELSKALENLNDAAETLEQFGNSIKGFFSK